LHHFSSHRPSYQGFTKAGGSGEPFFEVNRNQTATDRGFLISIDSAWASQQAGVMSPLLWYVAHTLPRCEKKMMEYCGRKNLAATLPCYRSAHKYRGKAVVFQKPLFPGYVFIQMQAEKRGVVLQSDHLANLLDVHDQELFARQLDEVMRALETDLEIRLAPTIGEGTRVKIKSGPLRGIDGLVEKRYGMNVVLLRLDFIGQAAAVKLDATDLEMI
jgi:transcription antitermination factor NusG